MKTIYSFLFVLLSVAGFAQLAHAQKINITAAKVDKSVKLAEILDIDIKSCKVLSYHFTANIGNHVKSMDVKDANLTTTIKSIVKELKVGDKFVIENVVYDCPVVEHKKNFSFVINK